MTSKLYVGAVNVHPQFVLAYCCLLCLMRLVNLINKTCRCFCHKNTIDMGFICSVCLSIFCKHQKKCSTCGWVPLAVICLIQTLLIVNSVSSHLYVLCLLKYDWGWTVILSYFLPKRNKINEMLMCLSHLQIKLVRSISKRTRVFSSVGAWEGRWVGEDGTVV